MSLPTPLRVEGCLLLLLAALAAQAQPTTNQVLAARAAKAFEQARQAWTAHPDQAETAWHLGRASYDWAEFATNTDQRASAAQAGITACHQLITRDPKSAPGHYYLAMDYGELAEAEAPSMAAYKLIREIEHEFKTATELDEQQDFAGPVRCLGLLYRDAPGWPISIGSRHKAREFLERAAVLSPDFPENQLNLVETFVRWHQISEAEKTWQKLRAIWPAARTKLKGEAWDYDWDDWTTRCAQVREEYQKAFKKRLEP